MKQITGLTYREHLKAAVRINDIKQASCGLSAGLMFPIGKTRKVPVRVLDTLEDAMQKLDRLQSQLDGLYCDQYRDDRSVPKSPYYIEQEEVKRRLSELPEEARE